MTAMYPQISTRYRLITGFGSTHRRLFGYLSARMGLEVPLEELRLITGDAVHTERRLRELRDLGAEITMSEGGGLRSCRMRLPDNMADASYQWIVRRIGADHNLTELDRRLLLDSLIPPS